MLLYRFLKALLRVAVYVFYKEVHVQGQEELPVKGPLIVAVNHPNTLMDPLLVTLLLRQRTGFLANAGIFANKLLRWVFSKLHLIPVYRQQDVKKGEQADNSASFRKCYEYLHDGGTLMIFPEGTSVNEMKLRKLKTGTARIALETAAQANFNSGLKIATVALNYSDPIRFRSQLFIRIAEPIAVDGYAARYSSDPPAAVQQLTELISEKLEQNLIITTHKEQEVLLKRIKKLYIDQHKTAQGHAMGKEEEFALQQHIGRAISYYQLHHVANYELIQQKVSRYFNLLSLADLKAGFFKEASPVSKKVIAFMGSLLFLLFTLPLYLLGLFTNYLPYILPSKIASRLGTDIEYRAGIMMLSGLLLFPLFYGSLLYLFNEFISQSLLPLVVFAFCLPLLGFFTLYYWRIAENMRSLFSYLSLRLRKKDFLKRLYTSRKDVLEELAKAEQAYVTSTTALRSNA